MNNLENQPTVILVLFTDYLSNVDSLAFFRVSSSIWSAHRSPQGRYRLKIPQSACRDFLRPSRVPAHSRDSHLASPSSGHYLVDTLYLADFYDFSLFSLSSVGGRKSSQGEEKEEIPALFRTVKQVSINMLNIDNMIAGGRRIHDFIETVRLAGNCPVGQAPQPFKAIKEILTARVKSLSFSKCEERYRPNVEELDFLYFPLLEDLTLWTINRSLRPGSFPSSLRKIHLYLGAKQEIEGILPDSIEDLSVSGYIRLLPSLPRNLRSLSLDDFIPIATLLRKFSLASCLIFSMSLN